jgi:ferritin-like metal-binding protein YciE
VGVLLSGALDDGITGLWDISCCGGVTAAQDPMSARSPELVQNALSALGIDHVAEPVELARLLSHLSRTKAKAIMANDDDQWRIELETRLETESGDHARLLDQVGELSSLTCPGCGGPLWKISGKAVERYRCRVGHAYSRAGLFQSCWESSERKLYSALQMLEENVQLGRRVLESSAKAGHSAAAVLREQVALLAEEADTNSQLIGQASPETSNRDRCRRWKTAGWCVVIRPRDALVNGSSFVRDPLCFCRANLGQMQLHTLEDLYIHELKDLYSAEKQLIKALPKMAKAADNEQLSSGFSEHFEQTKEHASRLEKILSDHKQSTRGAKCKGMEGLIAEGEELLKERADPEVKDAGLISAAQRVEHYEIAGYGTALTYADMFGDKEGARLLKMTLDEEKETDQKLTKIAKSSVNVAAAR